MQLLISALTFIPCKYMGTDYEPPNGSEVGILVLVRIPLASIPASVLIRFSKLSSEPVDGF